MRATIDTLAGVLRAVPRMDKQRRRVKGFVMASAEQKSYVYYAVRGVVVSGDVNHRQFLVCTFGRPLTAEEETKARAIIAEENERRNAHRRPKGPNAYQRFLARRMAAHGEA